MQNPLISFKKVTKIYIPGITALKDVTFDAKPKEFVSLVGRSGSGKTTLFKLLLCEESPTSGEIFFDGEEITKEKKCDISKYRRRIGVVFQDFKLLPAKTAYENVAYAMEVMGAEDEEIQRDVKEVLQIVGLTERANNFPSELSGGEKQRVSLARALIHRPEVILADEPTGNLDPYNKVEIIKLLLKINELGTTIMLSTHDKDIINSLGQRVITLEDGKIIRDEERGKFIL